MTPQESLHKDNLRRAWIALGHNVAFRAYTVIVEAALKESTGALADRQLSPEKRAEHLEAYHLADRLSRLRQEQIDALTKELTEYMNASDVIDGRLLRDE